MPRPQKKRFVCCVPENDEFAPVGCGGETVVMTVDEYETIRLIDAQGCTQAECSEQMHVSRTTVQSIYNDARRKIADAIVNGKRLVISGGDYIACNCYGAHCEKGCRKHCHRHQCQKNNLEE